MNWNNIKYFKPSEFECKCGCHENKIKDELVQMLDAARETAGVPFSVTSGYRCPKHNAAVGGVSESAHSTGFAVDVACTESMPRFAIIRGLIEAGFNRIGVAKTFIHADCDPSKPAKVMWLYS